MNCMYRMNHMNRTLLATVALAFSSVTASAETITVCASGCDYSDLSEAFSAAQTGDEIVLGPETFEVDSSLAVVASPALLRGDGSTDENGLPVSRLKIVGSGSGVYLDIGNADCTGLVFEGVSLWTSGVVSDLHFDFSGAVKGSYQPALYLRRTSGLLASDCSFESCIKALVLAENGNFSTTSVRDCTFSRCELVCDLTGGSSYSFGGSYTFVDCEFLENDSQFVRPAPITVYRCIANFTRCVGTDNKGQQSGLFYVYPGNGNSGGPWNSTLNISACDFRSNVAKGFGGVAYAQPPALINVANTIACENTNPPFYNWSNYGGVLLCNDCDDCSEVFAAGPPCNTGVRGDFNCDGVFDIEDFRAMQDQLGICPADLNLNGIVDGEDLGLLFSYWGPCIP